jgi:hypothetical protein
LAREANDLDPTTDAQQRGDGLANEVVSVDHHDA